MDRAGRSPPHYAALENDVDQALARLGAGDDPNLPDEKGLTPLHFAAQEGSLQVAELLIDRGARVDAVNEYGNTPLFVAVFNSRGRGCLDPAPSGESRRPEERERAWPDAARTRTADRKRRRRASSSRSETYSPGVADEAIREVSTWFRSRGFELVVSEEGAEWWATLTPIMNPSAAIVHYGRGDAPEAAALRARERFEQEQ